MNASISIPVWSFIAVFAAIYVKQKRDTPALASARTVPSTIVRKYVLLFSQSTAIFSLGLLMSVHAVRKKKPAAGITLTIPLIAHMPSMQDSCGIPGGDSGLLLKNCWNSTTSLHLS